MTRTSVVLGSLALGLALAGCGSASRSSEPLFGEDARASAVAKRQSQVQGLLQKQITPALDEPLQLLQFIDPRYPSFLLSVDSPDARGNVTVSFEVMPSGMVGATRVLPGSNEALHKPVIDAVRSWRFAAPVRDGQPARLQLQHTFRMEP